MPSGTEPELFKRIQPRAYLLSTAQNQQRHRLSIVALRLLGCPLTRWYSSLQVFNPVAGNSDLKTCIGTIVAALLPSMDHVILKASVPIFGIRDSRQAILLALVEQRVPAASKPSPKTSPRPRCTTRRD